MRPIVTAYAVGVAGNSFLPANLGTLVTLLMFVAIIPSCSFSGSVAAYLVQKIFYTIIGTAVYLYLFLSVPGSFDISFGKEHAHPAAFFGDRRRRDLPDRARRPHLLAPGEEALGAGEEGRRDPRPAEELPQAGRLAGGAQLRRCKMAVIAIFLAAFAIPVTFNSIMWVIGSGSLANVASFTPGAIGVTQATNALALKTCCDVPNNTAVAYSTAQQLVTSAWNVTFALILVVWVFGWTGGKQLVGGAYVDAKAKATEMKEDRKRKRDEKHAQKAAGEEAPAPEAGE